MTIDTGHMGIRIRYHFRCKLFISRTQAEIDIGNRGLGKTEGNNLPVILPDTVPVSIGFIHPFGGEGVFQEGGRNPVAPVFLINVNHELINTHMVSEDLILSCGNIFHSVSFLLNRKNPESINTF